MEVSSVSGTNPAPIPWILCGPGNPFDKTGDVSGSTATTFTLGLCSFRYFPVPDKVPPVPTPATKKSILPSKSVKISGPVVK